MKKNGDKYDPFARGPFPVGVRTQEKMVRKEILNELSRKKIKITEERITELS